MKRLALLILSALFLSPIMAQPISTVIKTQAIAMGRAIADHDRVTLMNFMLPELKEMAGDEAKTGQVMDSALAIFEAMGGKVTRITYGDPSPIAKAKGQWQAILPQTIALSTSFADIVFTSTLLAISKDAGKHWYFTDPHVYKEAAKKKTLPEIAPELVIPAPQKPQITPKKQ
jgi:hypothetical protein